jgi:hypothetical protein
MDVVGHDDDDAGNSLARTDGRRNRSNTYCHELDANVFECTLHTHTHSAAHSLYFVFFSFPFYFFVLF